MEPYVDAYCVKVHLKRNAAVRRKNWEGRKVNTVSIDDVEHVLFEHWPDPPKMYQDTSSSSRKLLDQFCVNILVEILSLMSEDF